MSASPQSTPRAFALVLHGHLPYVLSHGTWPHGSDMLFECAAESYLPLLTVFDRLVAEGISPKVTMGLTPVLCEQLAHPDFPEQFLHYLEQRIQTAQENREEFMQAHQPELADLAEMWHRHFDEIRTLYQEQYHRDIVGQYRRLQDGGHIEIITSSATHGYLPLLGTDASIQAQIKLAVHSYTRHFGRPPRGFWLPECAYRPRYAWKSPFADAGPQTPQLRKGVEEFLSESGLQYFIIDTSTLLGGATSGVYLSRFGGLQRLWEQIRASYQPAARDITKSPYRTYFVASVESDTPPVAVFTRDERTGIQVWSGEHGYPGDGWYLDFHKKHYPGGHRYWRVTSPQVEMGEKARYEPAHTGERVQENADHFCHLVHDLLTAQPEGAVLCAPYDAELFGHWWYEGPEWLYRVVKGIAANPAIQSMTCAEHLEAVTPEAAISLPEGSWGQGGFHWVWLNEWTEWIWREIYTAETEFTELVRLATEKDDPELQTIVNQVARELLLLEASDWPFLISTWSARDYAERRAALHYETFTRLLNLARKHLSGVRLSAEDIQYLETYKQKDSLFPELNVRWWGHLEDKAYTTNKAS